MNESSIHANYHGIFDPNYLRLPRRVKFAMIKFWERHLEMLYGKPEGDKPKGDIDWEWKSNWDK